MVKIIIDYDKFFNVFVEESGKQNQIAFNLESYSEANEVAEMYKEILKGSHIHITAKAKSKINFYFEIGEISKKLGLPKDHFDSFVDNAYYYKETLGTKKGTVDEFLIWLKNRNQFVQ